MDRNILYTAIQAALTAGAEIMSVYTDPNADFEIERKADNSPLTIADRKSHAVIAQALASTPYPLLSEEGPKSHLKKDSNGKNFGLSTRWTVPRNSSNETVNSPSTLHT